MFASAPLVGRLARNRDWRRFAEGRSLTTSDAPEFDGACCSESSCSSARQFRQGQLLQLQFRRQVKPCQILYNEFKDDDLFVGQGGGYSPAWGLAHRSVI